jgi:hypothetical protein
MVHFNRYTNEELIRVLDNGEYLRSPIIKTLYDRLSAYMKNEPDGSTNESVECPICVADLRIRYDAENELYELRYDTDNQ